MSRIGKLPIHVPAGVTVTIKDNVAIANYMGNGDATNSDLNFLNCIFQGNTSQMGDSTYSAIRLMS